MSGDPPFLITPPSPLIVLVMVSDMPPTLKMQSPCNVTGPSNSVVAEVPLLTVVADPFPLKTKFLFQATLSAENESSAPDSTMLVPLGSPMPGVRPENSMIPCRSEEHTSELQSLRHLVCRLL